MTPPFLPKNYFQGRWLLIARVIWIILFLVSVVLLVVFVINFYASEYRWSQDCSLMPIEDQTTCALTQQVYRQLGIPLGFRSIYFSIGVVIQVLSWILVGLLIFSKSSHKPFEFFFSLMLVVSGTLTLDPTIPAEIRLVYPVISPLLSVMEWLGGVLMVIWYLFPDGRFAPRWMRWGAVFFIAQNLWPMFIPERFWPAPLSTLIVILVVSSFIFSFVYRYKISNSLQRQQIKWAIASLSIFMIVAIVWQLHFSVFPASAEPGISQVLWSLSAASLFFLTRALLAASIAIAILRYRLWDIDFIINRSLVYGALTAILIAIFAGSLFIVSSFVQGQSFIVAFGITALVAGMSFNSARRQIQRFVDKHFYHIEIDYQKAVPPNPVPDNTAQVPQPTNFGAYQNLELIGCGGMAEVYKAIHPKLGILVAIKIMLPHLVSETEFRQRFNREAKIVKQLEHANIVRVYDSGEQDGKPYMVMEYLAGKDVRELLEANGKLSLTEVARLVQQIADALDYAHAAGLVHRDIKPSNILIDQRSNGLDRAVLTDFGIAKIINAQTVVTRTGGMLGTLNYIAPEQIQGASNIDGKADIYALGVMVYQLLTGELPFKHQNPGALLIAHLTQPPPDPCDIVPDLPVQVAMAIQRAMAKKPDERFTSAAEFGKEISTNET